MALRGRKVYEPFCTEQSKYSSKTDLKESFKILKTLIYDTPYGGFRRTKILELLKSGVEYYVNGEHGIQTKNDPDLKRLLKEGKIELVTQGRTRFKRTFVRYKSGRDESN